MIGLIILTIVLFLLCLLILTAIDFLRIYSGDYSYLNEPNTAFVAKILSDFLRFLFILRHKDISKQVEEGYHIYNKNVLVIYNKRQESFTCYDLKKSNKKIVFRNFRGYNRLEPIEIFDKILYSFTYSLNYDNIEDYLRKNNMKIIEKTEENNSSKISTEPKNENIVEITIPKKIDINKANEEEIAKFPGINIITAKRIVRKRDLQGGFKTKEDFLKLIKVKKHFLFQIENMTEISNYDSENKSLKNNERTVDF